MLEKFCRWWPVWYLLFFCHGSEGQLQWVVKEKVTAYGQNLILFCPIENCCSEPAGWFVGPKTIILDIKTFSNDPKVKYHGTYNKDGFGVVIRNLSEADLNVTYHCNYGFDVSTPKYLLHGDVFRENVPDKDKEIDTAAMYKIVVAIVVIMVGAIIGMAYSVYISRTEEEIAFLENQQECFEVEITQKGPITVGYGATIKIDANIISNSTGSLQVYWQKTHNNCSTTLMINHLKYSGSSCDVNNPQLVINNVDKEDAGIYKIEVISPTETKSSPGVLLELHGDEAEALSKEENNFLRFYYTCQKIATQAVRLFFDSKELGHTTLESFLNQHKSSLTSQRSGYKCTEEQELILFPGGQVVVSAKFDFTLLYKLIRNLLTAIPAPISGWGKMPLPEHLNETDDIERIRYFRNFIAHNTELEICDADFSTRWTDLSQAIARLSKGSLSKDVESMITKSFDKCTKNEMEENIRKEQKQMCKDFVDIQKQVDANKQNIADNKQDIADIKQDIADSKQNNADNKQETHNIKTRHMPLNIQDNLEKGLMYVASKLGFDWTQVALSLDITQAEIEQIQLDNPFQVVNQIKVALIRWRNRQHKRPQQDTIKQLIEALEVPERRDIIDDLREIYGIDDM